MNTQEIFHLNKLRCELAMAAALQDWQSPAPFDGLECPRCLSRHVISKGLSPLGKQRYTCKGCGRTFAEEARFECTCQVPGRLPKCQQCLRCQQFLTRVKKKAEELRGLSRQELERLHQD